MSDPPVIQILATVEALLQTAFDATVRTVGDTMTVHADLIPIPWNGSMPICRIFPAEEQWVLGTNGQIGNALDGKSPDTYGWVLEYEPSAVMETPVPPDTIRTQLYRDMWLVVSVLTNRANARAGGVISGVKRVRTRYPFDPYAKDLDQEVMRGEGEFRLDKVRTAADGTGSYP